MNPENASPAVIKQSGPESTEPDFYQAYADFLSGKKLDVGRRFSDLSMPVIVDRVHYLRRRCMGMKVLHIGCLDHPEVILKRIANGGWLHSIVSDASARCVGIDVNSAARDYVREQLGIDNICLLDLSKPVQGSDFETLSAIQWDLILCPEVLEHITNHELFLQNLHRLAHPNTTLVLTVPNAFRFANFINALRRFELVNSDHRYWFTVYTLCRLLVAHGWRPRRIVYYDKRKSKLWLRMSCQLATRLSRSFSDGIIVEAQAVQSAD